MVDFSNGNLCGASIELNNVLSKLVDAKTEIESKMNDPASTAAAAFQASQNKINALTSKLQTVEIPPLSKLNLQSEIESLLSQVPGSVGYAIALAKITLEFKDDIENKGLTLETILAIATTAQNEICDVVPNFEKESGSIEPAVEKPPAVKQAAKPAEPETPSVVVQNPAVEKTSVELKQKKEDYAVSSTPPEKDTAALKITKETKTISINDTTAKVAEQTSGVNVAPGSGFLHKSKVAREYVKFDDITTSGGFTLKFSKLIYPALSVREVYIFPQFAIRDFLVTPKDPAITAGAPELPGQFRQFLRDGGPPYYESEYGPHMVQIYGYSLGMTTGLESENELIGFKPEINSDGSVTIESSIKLEGDHPGNITSVKSISRRKVGGVGQWVEKDYFIFRTSDRGSTRFKFKDSILNKRFGGYAAYITYDYLDNYDADIAV